MTTVVKQTLTTKQLLHLPVKATFQCTYSLTHSFVGTDLVTLPCQCSLARLACKMSRNNFAIGRRALEGQYKLCCEVIQLQKGCSFTLPALFGFMCCFVHVLSHEYSKRSKTNKLHSHN